MHTNTFPAKVIKLATHYPYSHVGLSLEKECHKIYSFGRKNLRSFLNSGFCIEMKNGPFFNLFHETICKIYEIPVTEEQYQKIENILAEMTNQKENYKYDYWGMIPRFIGIPVSFKNRYVCSYFVAHLLEAADIYQFNKPTYFITPKDFDQINTWNKIYEGYYLAYKN